MKIQGVKVSEIPNVLMGISTVIESLLDLTNAKKDGPDIRASNSMFEMPQYKGIFVETKGSQALAIYAGGVDISEIVSQRFWDSVEVAAEQDYILECADNAANAKH